MRNRNIGNKIFFVFNVIVLVCALSLFIYVKFDMNRGESKAERNIESEPNTFEEKNTIESNINTHYNEVVDNNEEEVNDDCYDEPEEVSIDVSSSNIAQNTIMVNKEYILDRKYEPDDLVELNVHSTKEVFLRKEAAENLEQMFSYARVNGINLIAVSGFRSYEYQEDVYNNSINTSGAEYTEQYVAVPGASEHQTGLAVDVGSEENTLLTEAFENTEEYQWLDKNMHKYGFILRYPRDKEEITQYEYEPWHLRYVGVEVATYIKNNNITLEEYLE